MSIGAYTIGFAPVSMGIEIPATAPESASLRVVSFDANLSSKRVVTMVDAKSRTVLLPG